MRTFKSSQIPAPPFCICWNLIPKDKKIGLEIGAGNGLFSLRFTEQNGDWFMIAVERTANKFKSFDKLSLRYPNYKERLFYFRADGVNLVTHEIPKESIDQIFLIYPNPHIKSKQENLRWHNMPFFTELLSRLKPGGKVELRTNLDWYKDEFKNKITSVYHFSVLTEERLSLSKTPDTLFERKYLQRAESCFRLIFEKGLTSHK